MLLREVPAFSRVRVKGFGSIAEVDPDILVNGLDDVVPVWTHCERAENPFATVEVRGVVDHHLGLVRLPDDAQVEIVDGPRYAGQPETLAASATPVQPPEGSKGTLKTPEGWPRLIWQSDLLFSPVQGWSDAELAVETLLCALSVAPATEPGLRPMLLAALNARYAKVVKDPVTYPPSRIRGREGAPQGRTCWSTCAASQQPSIRPVAASQWGGGCGRAGGHDVSPRPYLGAMANFITGTHHCPDCREPQSGSRPFEEIQPDGTKVDWCAFQCRQGHIWARPGMQAVK